jgi:uncharacterized protein YutE (UPF0331/DUF86 family)
MSPSRISRRVVLDRLAWVESMLAELRALPLGDRDVFMQDRRNSLAAESCLRRALEALLDLGRHITAKGFGLGVTEYREIATRLEQADVLEPGAAELLRVLAGYRNRLVHFYHEVSTDELYQLCSTRLGDIELLVAAYRRWLQGHAELLDEGL